MRILFTTRGSSGHLLPLAPVARACIDAGHEVRVAAQSQHRGNLEREQLPFVAVADPPEEEWMPLLGSFGALDIDAADALMIRDFFGGIDTRAALPDLLGIVETWRPHLIVRESWEFASTIAAEVHGVPLARVGLGLAWFERHSTELAAPAVDEARVTVGLPADPTGQRLSEAPYLTAMPELLDLPPAAAAPVTHRFRRLESSSEGPAYPLPAGDGPLVLVSFGSVAAGPHLPYFPAVYRDTIDALSSVDARVLVTVGQDGDPEALRPWPANVHVERWVPQDAVAPHAAAIVCHGGYGSTLGALSHGVPLVMLPLFSGDQWANAEAVERAGAGVALDAERNTRGVLALPGAATIGELEPALRRVLEQPSFGDSARSIAAAMQELPRVDDMVGVLAGVAEAAA